jgi:hypothetical protein
LYHLSGRRLRILEVKEKALAQKATVVITITISTINPFCRTGRHLVKNVELIEAVLNMKTIRWPHKSITLNIQSADLRHNKIAAIKIIH